MAAKSFKIDATCKKIKYSQQIKYPHPKFYFISDDITRSN